MTSSDTLQDFIDFLQREYRIENKMFQLDPIFDQFGTKIEMEPVGGYFIYQQNAFQYKWWSYNLQQLKEIVDHQGGMVMDENNRLLYIKYPPI